ncbi:MAG: DNA methyltransferase, partial [Nisaea sp.]|uniref:DNA methyltransferase n=1 Tax=Nisaea sp. TaxID=2024842 RepID=UPI0032674FE7
MSSQEPETYLSLEKKPKAATKAEPSISLEKKRQNTDTDSDDPALPQIDAGHLHKSFQPPLSEGPDALEFLKDIREASDHGKLTSTYIDQDIPYYCGAFFKSGGERLHALYEFPYRAAFPPFLPAFFINALSCEGDIVHDPFGGSGTVAIEAARTGRIAHSSDINPLAKMITVPRIGPEVTLEAVDQALATVDWEKGEAAPLDLSDAFFHPQTAFKLQVLRRWLELNISLEGSETDHITAWIFMVVLARLTGHSQGYMSGYTLPPNQATTVARQRRINAKRGETPPEKDVRSIILKKTASLLRNGMPPFNSNHRIEVGP